MARKQSIRILGIETSCDETAAAVVVASRQQQADSSKPTFAFDVRSNVVASQVQIHAKYGGVVPEVAAREHVTAVLPTIQTALAEANSRKPIAGSQFHRMLSAIGYRLPATIDAIAVTAGPGLITALSVGAETARSLAYAWGKPLIAVNHIEGHVMSALLTERGQANSRKPIAGSSRTMCDDHRLSAIGYRLVFPALALIVSGGHTELLLMRGWGTYECIGATRDDAAGEAFDKVGKLLGLPYPGGPAVARAAEEGDPNAFNFPRGMMKSGNSEFSFSGLKTAVRYLVQNHESRIKNKGFIFDVCASFQQAVVDVLVAKTVAAAKRYDVKTVLLGGGVAANTALRAQLDDDVRMQLPDSLFLIPHSSLTGDNAAMIAAAGGVRLLLGESTRWQELDVDANWELGR